MSAPIPDSIHRQFGDQLPTISFTTAPWLPFPWPLQISSWGLVYAEPQVAEIEWVRGILQLQLSHPPTPRALPRDPQTQDPLALSFCWGLNRIVHAPQLDRGLQDLGYDLQSSQALALEPICQHQAQIPEVLQVLLCLELIYRQISPQQQTQLKAVCGEDVMKAAYQLNMMCIDPEDQDRTLLQIQRIGLKLCQADEERVRQAIHLQLSDGRQL